MDQIYASAAAPSWPRRRPSGRRTGDHAALRHRHRRQGSRWRHDGLGARRQRRARADVERGDYVPREPENWSPQAVWHELRYRTTEQWLDAAGAAFVAVHALQRRRQYQVLGQRPVSPAPRGLRRAGARRRRVAGLADRPTTSWRRTTTAPNGSIRCTACPATTPRNRRAARTRSRRCRIAGDGADRRSPARQGAAPLAAAARSHSSRSTRRLRAVPHLQLVSLPPAA